MIYISLNISLILEIIGIYLVNPCPSSQKNPTSLIIQYTSKEALQKGESKPPGQIISFIIRHLANAVFRAL